MPEAESLCLLFAVVEMVEPGFDAGFLAEVAGLIEMLSEQIVRQILLFDEVFGIVVGILITDAAFARSCIVGPSGFSL